MTGATSPGELAVVGLGSIVLIVMAIHGWARACNRYPRRPKNGARW